MTFFDDIKYNFKDVTIEANNGIKTSEFLEASESLVTLFDLLGSTAFGVVQKDMTGNIKKIREKMLASPGTSETLQDVVKSEVGQKSRDATQGLLWLSRGLQFTAIAMRNSLSNPNEELAKSFQNAYGESLTKYHNFVVRGVFKVAMNACPYRKDFYEKLGSPLATVQAQLEEWLSALEKIVKIISDFFAEGNYGKGL